MSDRDFEAEAKADGWVPQADWKGDPNKWIPAEDFVKRGETILPIVQAKYRRTVEEVADLKRKFEEREGVFSDFQKFQEQALAKANKERDQLITQLEEQRAKAITDGDGQTFTQTDKRIQELRAESATPPKKDPPRESPEVTAWKAENKWYTTDSELTGVADGLADVVARENPGLKGKAFLDKLTERVKTVVPHKFENPRRQEQITGEPGSKKGSSKSKGYDDLPVEARAACDKFVKTIPGFTKEKYLSQYTWEQ
jgi:hypothetical protein